MFGALGGAIGGLAGLAGDIATAPALAFRGIPPRFTVAGVRAGVDAGLAVGDEIFVGLICYLCCLI